MRRTAGITLMEVLVGIVMAAIITAACVAAFNAAMRWQETVPAAREGTGDLAAIQQRIRRILAGAYLDPDQTDPNSYFIMESASGASDTADQVIFTSVGSPPDGGFLSAVDDQTFEDLNSQFGPQAGLAEIQLGLTPVGEPTTDEFGLYLRQQRPSDGDTTQGGRESLALPGVESISFEAYDGAAWTGTWNTQTGDRRLPAAIRVIYTLEGEGLERSFVVALPNSDVTPLNPAAGSEVAQ
jgi:type II secretory pathway pseudopilin PulG